MSAVKAKLLVVSGTNSPELAVLKDLPPEVEIVGVGKTPEDLAHLTPEQWASINVLLNCGVLQNAASKVQIQVLWNKLPGLKWMHSASAGLDHLLFPELVNSPIPLTNAKGVYSNSLAEYTLFVCNYFAKDLPRLRENQKNKKWDSYEVEELRGKTFGVIGYGDIGQACARLARAYRMRVVALRRRPELTAAEVQEGVLDKLYTPDQLNELMSVCDYVVAATPYTPETDKMVNASAIAAMKPNAVFINVGRGKCVDEQALIQALQEKRIRGAGLDVFATEPLPVDNPLWHLENVLVSPHCADRTKEFQFESLQVFVDNLKLFVSGQDLKNVVDKEKGY